MSLEDDTNSDNRSRRFNAELIAYQQTELKELLKDLRDSVAVRLDRIEEDIGHLKNFRAAIEARADEKGPPWLGIVAGILTAVGTAIAALAAGVHP